jgi:uncharacterized protein YheU (UPF0270 family)
MIEIPHQSLSDDALCGVIDEYITRESRVTDGTLESKRTEILRQLEEGRAIITYDSRIGTTQLIARNGPER